MNPTDEFILDAFKQQGMLTEEVLAEIISEVESEGDSLVGDKDLAVMNGVLAKTGMPEGEVVNFFVHYEIDDDTSRHVLKLDKYGGDEVDSWMLLEPKEAEGE